MEGSLDAIGLPFANEPDDDHRGDPRPLDRRGPRAKWLTSSGLSATNEP
jgi:hypothetical protein